MTTAATHAAAQDLIQRLPKVDLHFHMAGTLRPATLATQYDMRLPRSAEALYVYRDFYDFIDVLRLVGKAIRSAADFERVAYEAIEDAARTGQARHLEMSFNPQYFVGVPYTTQVQGLAAGIAAARHDFGVSTLLLASIDRGLGLRSAQETMEAVLAHRHALVVGVGLDGPEHAGPPAMFQALFARAGRRGSSARRTPARTTRPWSSRLRCMWRTAWTCWDATAWTTATTCWPTTSRWSGPGCAARGSAYVRSPA